ncbi:MAG: phage head closure protein [Ahrensia sp.]|nr:phage head closure protein [Ahrensia sp.]
MNLDRRIQFQRATITDDGFSQVETFANHGVPYWANKKDVSDSERMRAGEISATISSRFIVRSSEFICDITPKDRLVYRGRTYEINGVKETGDRNTYVEITAGARIDQ